MEDLRRRLQRLGITTGREFTPRPRADQRGPDIDALLDGEVLEAEHGTCYRVARIFDPQTRHGSEPLGEWLARDAGVIAGLSGDARMPSDLHHFVFLDTETTGLGGGALAFLVGVGYFNSADEFEVHQYFLRDPAEEAAMLALLQRLLQPGAALVTFNGRAFDVPLLAGRYVLSRQRSHVASLPNLDLLQPARRLWRRRLQSCALGSLESNVLGVRRTGADVPGYLIPAMYRRYLETRDAREMVRVLYHNEVDLLSMVALGALMGRAFEQPTEAALHVEDRLSLAQWYGSRGAIANSEAAYRAAADEAPDEQSRYDALVGLAHLLKRTGRHDEALPLWADVADLKLDTLGHQELAKHHEWRTHDLQQALLWTERGIHLAESWRPGWRRTDALRDLLHRRERLLRKLARAE